MRHICSAREEYQYYMRGKSLVPLIIFSTHKGKFIHFSFSEILLRVMKISSRVLMMFLTGTEDPYGYCRHVSQVLIIFLALDEDPNGDCISSRVLKIVYTG